MDKSAVKRERDLPNIPGVFVLLNGVRIDPIFHAHPFQLAFIVIVAVDPVSFDCLASRKKVITLIHNKIIRDII